VLLAALVVCACRESEPRAPACPDGFVADAARATRIFHALERDPEGAKLIDEARSRGAITSCFGSMEVSAVTTERVVLFDEQLGDEEAAARLGHLIEHVVEGLSAEKRDGETCEEVVRRALAHEAAALSRELRLRRALGVGAAKIRYELEEAFWAAQPDDREALVLAYLEAHPNGAPGIDALAAGYAQRCRRGPR